MKRYDVMIIGGSYAGLAAAMALGRALKNVLIVDEGKPCNRQTPHSHNFLTNDGKSPAEIAAIARDQVKKYETVQFSDAVANSGRRTETGFEIGVSSGEIFSTSKIIFATGIRDILPEIEGMKACWGISALHCPYCHGYEVRNEKTAILGNADAGFDFTRLIFNWTKDLTLLTNGTSKLTAEQKKILEAHHIGMIEKEIERLEHNDGYLQNIVFKDGTKSLFKALYAPGPFEQKSNIPESLGCATTEEGYIRVDAFQETSVPGIYACGDNSNRMRTVANAVATGTTAGMVLSKKMILEEF